MRRARRFSGIALVLLLAACSGPGPQAVATATPTQESAVPTATPSPVPTPIPTPSPTPYRVTQRAAEIVLAPIHLPAYLGFYGVDGLLRCTSDYDCSAFSAASIFTPTDFKAKVEVFADSRAATAYYEASVATTPMILAQSAEIPLSASHEAGDQSAAFLGFPGQRKVTVIRYARVGNSVHEIRLTGSAEGVTGDALTPFAEELGAMSTYMLAAQLRNMAGAESRRIPDAAAPADPRHPLGHVVAYPNGWQVSVLSVAEQPATDSRQPRIGSRYVSATVRATNAAPSGIEAIEAFDLRLVDATELRGFVLGRAFYELNRTAGSGSVSPGRSVTIAVTFELPLGVAPATIAYKPVLPLSPSGYAPAAWKVE